MAALLSSKVNQWTLLLGGLPIAFSLSSGEASALPLDDRQQIEVWLTAAQSAFAVAVVLSLSVSYREAIALFGLFMLQFLIPLEEVRIALTARLPRARRLARRVGRRELFALFRNAREEIGSRSAARSG